MQQLDLFATPIQEPTPKGYTPEELVILANPDYGVCEKGTRIPSIHQWIKYKYRKWKEK